MAGAMTSEGAMELELVEPFFKGCHFAHGRRSRVASPVPDDRAHPVLLERKKEIQREEGGIKGVGILSLPVA